MRRETYPQIQIALRPAVGRIVALPGKASLAPSFHPGGDIHFQGFGAVPALKRKTALAALHGVLKRDGNIGLDVAAPLGTGRIAAERAAGAPALTAAEQGFEKVAEPGAVKTLTAEFLPVEREARTAAVGVAPAERIAAELLALLPVGPELVIHLPLLLVFENFVRLVYFLELFLGFLVSGVEIRVVLAGELLEGFCDFILGSFAPHTQYFVIILIFDTHTLASS